MINCLTLVTSHLFHPPHKCHHHPHQELIFATHPISTTPSLHPLTLVYSRSIGSPLMAAFISKFCSSPHCLSDV